MKTLRLFSTLAMLATASFVFVSSAEAQQLSKTTQDFVKNAAIGSQFEIQSSRIALEKAKNADVKQFAQKMIDDHTNASNQLKAIVQSSMGDTSLAAPAMDTKHQRMLDALQSASGSDFDHQYHVMQVSAHNEAVALFQNYAQNGDDSALKAYATKTLPTLQQHQQHLEQLKL